LSLGVGGYEDSVSFNVHPRSSSDLYNSYFGDSIMGIMGRAVKTIALAICFYAAFNSTLTAAPIYDLVHSVGIHDQSGYSPYSEYELCHAKELHIPVYKTCGGVG
jgi:hypothetical protein